MDHKEATDATRITSYLLVSGWPADAAESATVLIVAAGIPAQQIEDLMVATAGRIQ